MRIKRFEYVKPATVWEALDVLTSSGGLAKVLAGGTDLLVSMKKGLIQPELVVDINGLDQLRGITVSGGRTREREPGPVRIGSLTRISEIEASEVIFRDYRALHDAAETLGTPQVRAMGTIGGNLCNASPAADTAPALMVLGATLDVLGPVSTPEEHSSVSVEQFFVGPGRTILGPDRLLSGLSIPPPMIGQGSCYLKFTTRNEADMAIVGIAVAVSLDESLSNCEDIKIGLGAVAPTPIRAYRAEELLKGSDLTPAILKEAARVASEEASPISDVRASASYRIHLIRALLPEAVKTAVERANRRAIRASGLGPDTMGGSPND